MAATPGIGGQPPGKPGIRRIRCHDGAPQASGRAADPRIPGPEAAVLPPSTGHGGDQPPRIQRQAHQAPLAPCRLQPSDAEPPEPHRLLDPAVRCLGNPFPPGIVRPALRPGQPFRHPPGRRETVKVLSRASIETVAGFIDESGW